MNKIIVTLVGILAVSAYFPSSVLAATKKPTKQEIAQQKEEARKAEEARLANEEARKAEEARLANEEARKAEETRLANEEARKKFVEGAKAVVTAYRKLQYKVESGINYREFRAALSDAQVTLKMFRNSKEGKFVSEDDKYGDYHSGISMADLKYGYALDTWSFMVQNAGNYGYDESLKQQTMDSIRERWKGAAEAIAKAESCINQ